MDRPSNDSYAILLLCSDLALRSAASEIKAYTIRQWANLSGRLSGSGLAPGALFDVSSKEVRDRLGLTDPEVNRIEALMARAGRFGMELAALNDKGIFAMTAWDAVYPGVLKAKLKKLAPPVLFFSGDLSILSDRGVAIVGSREIDDAVLEFTNLLAMRCAGGGLNIVSGGARGVDSIAENAANRAEGNTVIVVADSLEKKIRQKETRDAIMRKKSVILSAFRPDMPFQAFAAMERNKYVYALSDYVVVVSSDYDKGGTWSGATENLKHGWVPMFVRKAENVQEGNRRLLSEKSVFPITSEVLNDGNVDLSEWFAAQAAQNEIPGPDGPTGEAHQQTLFELFP